MEMFGCLGLLHLILPPLTPSSRLPRAAAFLALLLAASLPQLTNGRAPGVNYEGRPSSGSRPQPDATLPSTRLCSTLNVMYTSILSQSQNSLILKKTRIAASRRGA